MTRHWCTAALIAALVGLPAQASDLSSSVRPTLALGGYLVAPTASPGLSGTSLGVSLEPGFEVGNLFVAALLAFNNNAAGAGGAFELGIIGGSVCYHFGDGPILPYGSIGFASAYEAVTTSEDGGTQFSRRGAADRKSTRLN